MTSSTLTASRASCCRSSDCEPSVFEMADRKRSGSFSRGGEQAPPWPPPQFHGEGLPSPSPTRRMLTRAGRTGPASDAGRTVSDPSAAARVRVCRPAASGACRPRPSPCFTPCQVERLALHAQSSHPPPERVADQTRSERRQTPAGRTPPPAGPGTAVRPPSRGREERRPRDGRRTPALATAHPAGLKNGPARRVRLSQIPASRTAASEERPPPLNARAVESPLSTLTAPAENAASPQAGTSSLTSTPVPDEGTALSGRPA